MIRVIPASTLIGVNHITPLLHIQWKNLLTFLKVSWISWRFQAPSFIQNHLGDAEFNQTQTDLPEPSDKQPL
jgi:hypothetical protein